MASTTTSPSNTRKLEQELALLTWHLKMARMTPMESAIYHNGLVHKREHFKW